LGSFFCADGCTATQPGEHMLLENDDVMDCIDVLRIGHDGTGFSSFLLDGEGGSI
jgi:hypothetical protein